MIKTVAEYQAIQTKIQLLIAIHSIKPGGWRADEPMLKLEVQQGLDIILGEDFLKDMNKELGTFVTKQNRKILKQTKKVEKQLLADVEIVEGLKEELFDRYPALNPKFVPIDLDAPTCQAPGVVA